MYPTRYRTALGAVFFLVHSGLIPYTVAYVSCSRPVVVFLLNALRQASLQGISEEFEKIEKNL
jgi:hypothetical protein